MIIVHIYSVVVMYYAIFLMRMRRNMSIFSG